MEEDCGLKSIVRFVAVFLSEGPPLMMMVFSKQYFHGLKEFKLVQQRAPLVQ
jgi:hypothetical protein